MSLSPDSRVLLTEALQPPPGYTVECAVGTTYSLDLTALLLAPMSFALFDHTHADQLETADPIRLLDAVRRHAGHTTVFCQAGAIGIPTAYRSILTFVEGSVAEVDIEGGLFHPKMWALRFTRGSSVLHRVVVLSRNLTFDQSWDTALVLNEAKNGSIDATPAADFLRSLPALSTRPLDAERLDQVQDLANTLTGVQLAAPEGFYGGNLLPLGGMFGSTWPFPDGAHRMLAISPFLSQGRLNKLASITAERTLISRAETLDDIGAASLDGWQPHVLQALAETGVEEAGDDSPAAAEQPEMFADPRSGLHAKTIVCDLPGGMSRVVTGSANLTEAAWTRNVEFEAVLEGHTDRVGVGAALEGLDRDVPGLESLLEPYSPQEQGDNLDEEVDTWMLEEFHHQLAKAGPVMRIEQTGEDTVQANLTITLPEDLEEFSAHTKIWPLSLPEAATSRSLEESLTWEHSPENISAFLALATTWGRGKDEITRRCVIMADLDGDLPDRTGNAVLSILQSRADVLRYMVFLLGDPTYDALLSAFDGGKGSWDSPAGHNVNIALFEPLVRAIGQDTSELAQIADLIRDLREIDSTREADAESLLPEGLDELWEAVWQAHLAEVGNA